MEGIIIESAVQIGVTLVLTLIGVLGTWLTLKIGKYEQLKTINAAQQEVILMAQQTVGELQQTVVDGLKAGRKDGKLTKEEIKDLGIKLYDYTLLKLSEPTRVLLEAAAVDIGALIAGAGESWLNRLKS